MNHWRAWLRSAEGRRQQRLWAIEYARHREETAVLAMCLEGVVINLPELVPMGEWKFWSRT